MEGKKLSRLALIINDVERHVVCERDKDTLAAVLRRLGLTTYEFAGVESCSKLLGDRRRSCPTQRRMLDELNAFLATHQQIAG